MENYELKKSGLTVYFEKLTGLTANKCHDEGIEAARKGHVYASSVQNLVTQHTHILIIQYFDEVFFFNRQVLYLKLSNIGVIHGCPSK